MELKDDAAFRVQGAATNHGSLALTTGATMRVDGAFTQSHTGRLSLGNFCELILPGGGTIGGIMAGSAGTITGDVTLPGQTSPGSSPGRLTISGSAAFTPTTVFDAELAGETAGEFDVLNVTGPAVMNGTLAVILLNGYRPAAADTFTIVQAGAMTGSFGNAPHGQRVATVDGYGSFLVSYSATAVVLSAFEANPAPAPSATPQLPAPQILLPESPEPLLSFQLSGTPGRPYLIESSANLQTWTPFHAATLSSSGTLTAEFPFDAATAPRFFRARAP